MNVPVLDQDTHDVAVGFIQQPNNIGDCQLVIRKEITNGDLALGAPIESIWGIDEDLFRHLEAFPIGILICGSMMG